MTDQPPTNAAVPREAGRELDALVAEKVMGWTLDDEIDELSGRFWCTPDGFVWADNFEPSTDIAAAWTVAENLIAAKWYFCIERADIPGDAKWNAWIGRFNVYAATPALAICLAALQAVENTP